MTRSARRLQSFFSVLHPLFEVFFSRSYDIGFVFAQIFHHRGSRLRLEESRLRKIGLSISLPREKEDVIHTDLEQLGSLLRDESVRVEFKNNHHHHY